MACKGNEFVPVLFCGGNGVFLDENGKEGSCFLGQVNEALNWYLCDDIGKDVVKLLKGELISIFGINTCEGIG